MFESVVVVSAFTVVFPLVELESVLFYAFVTDVSAVLAVVFVVFVEVVFVVLDVSPELGDMNADEVTNILNSLYFRF